MLKEAMLKGKTAVVTGGGTGIGLAAARTLADEGCRVGIVGRRQDKLRQTAEAWPGEPPLLYRAVDVADRPSVNELFRWADEELERVEILVNSAGINVKNRTMAEMEPEQWDQIMSVNVTGAYNYTHAVLPQIRQRQDGLIINISSNSGKRATQLGGVAYSASKFALGTLGTAVSLEDADHGIRVTTIYPGEVDTPILEHRPQPVSNAHRAAILQPQDVADAVLMVARLPARAQVAEMLIIPTRQPYA